MTSSNWTNREVSMLRRYYGNSSNRAIGNYIGRTAIAVKRKANRLGLRKNSGASRHVHMVISALGRRRYV